MVLENLNPLKRKKKKKKKDEIYKRGNEKRHTGLNIFKNLPILSTTQASC
jgi:hypothetical protein